MSRGLGATRALADWLEPVEPLFAVLTQLGDTWLLAALAIAFYALGSAAPPPGWDRRRGAVLVGVTLLAVAATGVLKAAVGLPRPPGAATPAWTLPGLAGDVYGGMATAHGYGFPSGHTVGATAVYGTLSGLVSPSVRRRAIVGAAGLVAVVATSRVALGVHYGVDIAAGALLGFLLAALALRFAARPRLTFVGAFLAATGWAVASGGAATALGTVGLCVGALIAWTRLSERLLATVPPTGAMAPALGVGTLVVGLIALAAIEFGSPTVAAVAGLVGMATIVALPLAAGEASAAPQKVSR